MSFVERFKQEIDNCPHCDRPSPLKYLHHEKSKEARDGFNRYTLYQCALCKEPILLDEKVVWNSSTTGKTFWGEVVGVVGTYPIKSHRLNSSAAPPEVARDFEDGWRCFYAGIYKASAVMFRRSLEQSLLSRGVEESRDLRKMIDSAFANRIVSQSEKDWAHKVRLVGNEAAHALNEVSKSDIEELGRFLETFLRIFYLSPPKNREG